MIMETEAEVPEGKQPLLDVAEPVLADGEYYLADGIKGVGPMPDYYDNKRFKTLSEQARSYRELEKKLGSFTGAPKDGYKLPEGIDQDDELAQEFIKYATESNMSQAGFERGYQLLSTQQGVAEQVKIETELAKLGDKAPQRIKTVETFLKNNMSAEQYQKIQGSVSTAESIELIEALILGWLL